MNKPVKADSRPRGPLAGIRVLDLSRVLAGPYCTMLLADLGAEVIKVERPGCGDDTRQWGPPFKNGASAYFMCCNRNKKSITVDLKSQAGQKVVQDLARCSDVLVENFLPGKLAGYGLDYPSLSGLSKQLVYCSITGFGQTGPRHNAPGYDLLVQALSGLMSITGEPGGPPMKVGVAIADLAAGLFASNAIMAALVGRSANGHGDYVEIALYDACLALLANVGSAYLMNGDLPRRYGNAHPSIVPYQVFAAMDASFVVAVGNDRQYHRLCSAIGLGELATDKRFASNADRVVHRKQLVGTLSEHFLSSTAEHWLSVLIDARVPCAPINELDAALSDEHVSARNMLLDARDGHNDTISMIGSPMKLSSVGETRKTMPPPGLGEHTEQVLQEILGYSREQIAQLALSAVT